MEIEWDELTKQVKELQSRFEKKKLEEFIKEWDFIDICLSENE